MLKSGGFWHRVITALVSATIAFTPFYIWSLGVASTSLFNHEIFWVTFINSLDTFAICEAVILVAIFVIAYPVERFLVKPGQRALKAAGTYALIGVIISAGFLLATRSLIDSSNYGLAIGFFVAIFGTATAFIGRLIYSVFFRLKGTVLTLTAIIALLVAIGILVQPIQASSPQADDFYPETFPQEVVRATNDVDENTGASGTNITLGSGVYDPNLDYTVTFRCKEANKAQYNVLIREQENLTTLSSTTITCSSTNIDSSPIDLGKNPLKVTMILEPLGTSGNLNGVSSYPDTWAVLAPTFAN